MTPVPGLVARRIRDLPAITYHAAYRRSVEDDPRVASLLTSFRGLSRRGAR